MINSSSPSHLHTIPQSKTKNPLEHNQVYETTSLPRESAVSRPCQTFLFYEYRAHTSREGGRNCKVDRSVWRCRPLFPSVVEEKVQEVGVIENLPRMYSKEARLSLVSRSYSQSGDMGAVTRRGNVLLFACTDEQVQKAKIRYDMNGVIKDYTMKVAVCCIRSVRGRPCSS